MKKFLTILLSIILAVMCLSTLSACGNKEITVNFVYNDEVVATKTVTIFNNALAPDAEDAGIVVPDGYKFMGWSSDPNWKYEQKDTNPLVSVVVHHDNVESIAINNVATLYAIIYKKSDIPKKDLVIGWYAKTSTSGLTENMIATTQTVFFTYLSNNQQLISDYLQEKGKTFDQFEIEYRAYTGDVASMGSAVNADGDVDILLGVGANITTTGGVVVKEKIGGIPMGSKTRYNARLTDTQPAIVMYAWSQTQEAFDCWKA